MRTLTAVLLTRTVLPVSGAGPSQWTRSRGGVVVDLFDLTPHNDGYRIALREGFGKPVYSSGFCAGAGAALACATSGTLGGDGLILITLKGDSARYRSWWIDGSLSWDGDFVRGQGVIETGAQRSQNSLPLSSPGQWTRSQNGAIVDLFDLSPRGDGAVITL